MRDHFRQMCASLLVCTIGGCGPRALSSVALPPIKFKHIPAPQGERYFFSQPVSDAPLDD